MAKKTAQKQEQMTEDEKQIRRRIGNATKADLAKWFMQIWNENNELKKQMNKKLEESKEYQSMVNQLQDETQLKKTAVKQQKKAEETAQKLEAECEKLRQQVAALQTAKGLPDAQETAQNTADNMSDGQATDDSETAQNGTQGGAKAIAEPLPKDMEEWQQEIAGFLMEAYKRAGKNRRDIVGRIVKTWCKAMICKEALEVLYTYFIKPQQVALDDAVTAQNALKSDLDKLQAEYQQATRHNARGAGRKLKLTAEQAEQVKKLSSEGLTYRKISEQVGISPATVMRYLKKM
jgi:Arc/MetJ family transcription regulator